MSRPICPLAEYSFHDRIRRICCPTVARMQNKPAALNRIEYVPNADNVMARAASVIKAKLSSVMVMRRMKTPAIMAELFQSALSRRK